MKKLIISLTLLVFLVGITFFIKPCFANNSCSSLNRDEFGQRLAKEARLLSKMKTQYKSSYKQLKYPQGDVPLAEGVCTDLIIRSYRKLGIDLQEEVHEDMKKQFSTYPQNWNLKEPDSNIDHRRVSNLLTFFSHYGQSLPITSNPCDYRPGDIVIWDTSIAKITMEHIGIVSDSKATWCSKRFKVAHHAWGEPSEDDLLFFWKIKGHFQYNPNKN